MILLMEEILHHLGCIKPCKYWKYQLVQDLLDQQYWRKKPTSRIKITCYGKPSVTFISSCCCFCSRLRSRGSVAGTNGASYLDSWTVAATREVGDFNQGLVPVTSEKLKGVKRQNRKWVEVIGKEWTHLFTFLEWSLSDEKNKSCLETMQNSWSTIRLDLPSSSLISIRRSWLFLSFEKKNSKSFGSYEMSTSCANLVEGESLTRLGFLRCHSTTTLPK